MQRKSWRGKRKPQPSAYSILLSQRSTPEKYQKLMDGFSELSSKVDSVPHPALRGPETKRSKIDIPSFDRKIVSDESQDLDVTVQEYKRKLMQSMSCWYDFMKGVNDVIAPEAKYELISAYNSFYKGLAPSIIQLYFNVAAAYGCHDVLKIAGQAMGISLDNSVWNTQQKESTSRIGILEDNFFKCSQHSKISEQKEKTFRQRHPLIALQLKDDDTKQLFLFCSESRMVTWRCTHEGSDKIHRVAAGPPYDFQQAVHVRINSLRTLEAKLLVDKDPIASQKIMLCPKCDPAGSKFEALVRDELVKSKTEFYREFQFEDMIGPFSGLPLRSDFYIPSNGKRRDILLDVDDQSHFDDVLPAKILNDRAKNLFTLFSRRHMFRVTNDALGQSFSQFLIHMLSQWEEWESKKENNTLHVQVVLVCKENPNYYSDSYLQMRILNTPATLGLTHVNTTSIHGYIPLQIRVLTFHCFA